MKALRKEPDQRYESAGHLLDDIRRYEKNLPVLARHGTIRYRLGKWLRRHHWTAASGITVVLSLVMGTGVALWQAREANQSAERATVALTETELALGRAEGLQEFLVDLFRSAQPDRPRNQLPTTEEILALGAERAMDEQSAAPAERVAMLMTIGDVYRRQNWHEEARPLLEAAVELAREHGDERPEDLARALQLQSAITSDPDRSISLLAEAERLIEGSEMYWDLFAFVRADRAWTTFYKGNLAETQELLRPVYEEMLKRDRVDARTRINVMSALVAVYSRLGKPDSAATVNTELLGVIKQFYGHDNRIYATELSKDVVIQYNLGRFDLAEAKAREAITLYDLIYDEDQPESYRAYARLNLAQALLYAGRFDESLAELREGYTELAQAQGRELDDWENHFLFRGRFFARMHRWHEAEQDLRKARELIVAHGRDNESSLTEVVARLAWTLCRNSKTAEGEAMLAELDSRPEGPSSDRPDQQAVIHEARAACYLRAGNLTPALREADAALAADNRPGRVMLLSDRRILRARILAALDRRREAGHELDQAEQIFLDLDLADHPHFSHIAAARGELYPHFVRN